LKIAILETYDKEFIIKTFRSRPMCGFEVVAFVSPTRKKKDEIEDFYDGLPLLSLESLAERHPDKIEGVFFGLCSSSNVDYWAYKLNDMGISNIYIPYLRVIAHQLDFMDDKGFDPRSVYKPDFQKPFIWKLMTHVADHCNLNCKSCNNFSPLEPRANFRSAEEYESNLQRIQELFDNVMLLGLQGGEPLLDPGLTLEFAMAARKRFPLADVCIYTNGLLIPSTADSILASFAELGVEIWITVYSETAKVLDEATAKLDRNGAKWYIFGERVKFNKYLTQYPFEDMTYNRERCISASCHYLSGHKIYKCVEAGCIESFDKKFGTTLYQDSGVDIHSSRDGWEAARTLTDACYLCAYCARHANIKIEWSNARDYKPEDWLAPHWYERQLANTRKTVKERDKQIKGLEKNFLQEQIAVKDLTSAVKEQYERIVLIETEREQLSVQIDGLRRDMDKARQSEQSAENRLSAIESSKCWKLTKPIRFIADFLRKG
jgi:hypothetical protein